MAVYFLNVKTFGRSTGSSAASAAAYRAGERIRDERTGQIYDHSDRLDVLHKEIVLPGKFADDDIFWARDRSTLWNTVELAETRKNARVAREYLVALPVELSHEQRVDLVQGFAHELVDRYGFALDVAVHAPREFPGSDPRNFHAHLLATTREAAIEGLGAKTTLELNDGVRRQLGLQPAINELLHVRGRWEIITNEALQAARIATRVDHRSLEAQGIDREPRPQIPRAAFELERRGYRSDWAERLREEHQARVETRRERSHSHAQSLAAQQSSAARPQSLEEIRREARENWLRYRASYVLQQGRDRDRGLEQEHGRGQNHGSRQGQDLGHGRDQEPADAARSALHRGRDDDLTV